MIRKTALLAGVAGAMLFAAPALAQDTTQTTAAPSAQTATPPTLTIQPGATVKGEGGVELGKLQGVRTNAAGQQELEVRGADGQLRAVPLGGLQQDGDGLSVAWSKAQYDAAAVIQPSAPASVPTDAAPPATAPDPSMPAMPSTTPNPAMPAPPMSPANPPAGEPTDPAEPAATSVPGATPPTLPPENPVGTTPTPPNGTLPTTTPQA